MGHIVLRQPWGVVDLDTASGQIFVQQDWRYTWIVFSPTVSPWTLEEKRNFHNTLDRQIWGAWSNRIRLRISGTSELGRRFAESGLPINFDVRWVTGGGHWEVTVRNMPAGSSRTTFRSNVSFGTRKIELDTMDLRPSAAMNDAGKSTAKFLSGPHEFGHALRAGDEYGSASPHIADTNSIMNVGRQVRPRHLQLVVDCLNTMAPGAKFAPPVTIP